jgi:hypothetical protein
MPELITQQNIYQKIFIIRGQRVMLNTDLAELYNIPTKVLNQSVKRNYKRFPDEFMFQLTKKEFKELVTNCDQFNNLKHSYQRPYVFTEPGVAMLSSVLNSDRAIQVNVQIIRAFIKLRQMVLNYADLRKKIEEMEQKYDSQFKTVFDALRELLVTKPKSVPKIGFKI